MVHVQCNAHNYIFMRLDLSIPHTHTHARTHAHTLIHVYSGSKLGACLLSNTCLGFGVEVISRLEQRTSGLRWDNVGAPIAVDDDFSMAWVMGMLIIDSVLYMTVAW